MASSASAPLTGDEIAAMAYAVPAMTPTGMGLTVIIVSIVMGALSVGVVALRIWVRTGLSEASARVWGPDDYLAVGGTIIYIPCVVFSIYGALFGLGSYQSDLPSILYAVRAVEYQFYWSFFYIFSSTTIKFGIGFACMRLDDRKRVRVPIAVSMCLIGLGTVFSTVFVLTKCTPVAATWNVALGTCNNLLSLYTLTTIVSAIQMGTDWVCAIVPFFIVARLNMRRRQKTSVLLILGLGIFASIATVVRMPLLRAYDYDEGYPTYDVGGIIILSNIECGLGIIGSSLPSLRKLFKFYRNGSRGETVHTTRPRRPTINLDTLLSGPPPTLGVSTWARASISTESTRELHSGPDGAGIVRKTEIHIDTSSPIRVATPRNSWRFLPL